MEGFLAIVKRPAPDSTTDYGDLLGIITVYHLDFFSYIPQNSPLRYGEVDDIDGTLHLEWFQSQLHPVSAQQAKGHGLKAHSFVKIEGGDGARYVPTGVSEQPSSPNDRSVGYELVDIFAPQGLWERRGNRETFARFGVFDGDNGKDDAANAPLKWDDNNEGGDLLGGKLAVEPVKMAKKYFRGLGTFSEVYLHNPYQGIYGSVWQTPK